MTAPLTHSLTHCSSPPLPLSLHRSNHHSKHPSSDHCHTSVTLSLHQRPIHPPARRTISRLRSLAAVTTTPCLLRQQPHGTQQAVHSQCHQPLSLTDSLSVCVCCVCSVDSSPLLSDSPSAPAYVNSTLSTPTANSDGFLLTSDKQLTDEADMRAVAAENDTSEPARAARRSTADSHTDWQHGRYPPLYGCAAAHCLLCCCCVWLVSV